MGKGGRFIVVIYADVLIGLNLYVTWFLLLAAEQLSGRRCKTWRRGCAALVGGFSSLAIFLPEMPFLFLLCGKLGLGAVITAIAGGRGSFVKRLAFFLAANFLFAGVMIAFWLILTPPRLIIRNGIVYYHIPAMTLAVSTILAYITAKLLVWFRSRGSVDRNTAQICISFGGREVILEVFHDSGNRLHSIGGKPVIVCGREALKGLLTEEQLETMLNCGKCYPAAAARMKMQLIPCETVNGSGMLAAFSPDWIRAGEKMVDLDALLAISEQPLHGDFQAVAGNDIFEQIAQQGKDGYFAEKMEKFSRQAADFPPAKIGASAALRLHKRPAVPSAASGTGGGESSHCDAPDRTGEGT